jgi:type I restriction enzyme S subunit
MREFRALSLGTTMRHIKRSALSQVKSVIPSQELRLKFDEFIEPIILSILNLTARNANLCRTRDLLLPRLVSGEVDVANLEIAV